MTAIEWVIPPSVLAWLDRIPGDRPVAMLIRHSVRDELPPGEAGYSLPINEVGHRLAAELGHRLTGRLRSVHTSPLVRTVQTAEHLWEGSRLGAAPRHDRLLGHPGAFIVDRRAGEAWDRLGHVEMMRRLVCDAPPPAGCADPEPAARFLVHHMLATAGDAAGLHAFVTHDSLVTATAAHLLGRRLTHADWPWYLEAAFFWVDSQERVHTAYREWHGTRAAPLVGLTERDAIGLARREVLAAVGPDCPARFFLAGGAFKALLTGRPPRDLDLWAATAADRAVLEDALLANGAEPLPERPYTKAFRVRDRVFELSLRCDASELEQRLERFDLGLAAVGVEHLGRDQWRFAIHPRAHESVRRGQVLLLDELPNWKHSLATLVRLRDYAQELGYAVPDHEVDRIWSLFEAQSPEVQRGMIERFSASSRFDPAVHAEATCRCR